LGRILLDQLGRVAEAIAEFREAVRLRPDEAGYHFNLAGALLVQGKPDEAIAESRAAVRLKPDDANTYNRLGRALLAHGKRDEAVTAYREAVRLEPGNFVYLDSLAVVLRDQGRWNEALAEFRKSIRLKPDDAGVCNNVAYAMALPPDRPPGEYVEAAEYARKAVALAPKDGNIHNTLALAEYRCGRWAESIAASERTLALRPGGNAWDWFFLAMAHARKGNKEEAARWFDKAVAWTKEKESDNAELRQFWTESAKLLGRPGPEARRP
jgi:tetratricopeptide (TPR) repeat protein